MLEKDDRFDVILCDVMMPQMSGIEFYEALLQSRPATAAKVVLTGGATTTAPHAEVGGEGPAKLDHAAVVAFRNRAARPTEVRRNELLQLAQIRRPVERQRGLEAETRTIAGDGEGAAGSAFLQLPCAQH